jgi:hypothetical protein
MSVSSLVVGGVTVCVLDDLATAAGWKSGPGGNVIVPSSVFFRCLAGRLTKPDVQAYATRLISSTRQIDQIQGFPEICSGATACLMKTIDR